MRRVEIPPWLFAVIGMSVGAQLSCSPAEPVPPLRAGADLLEAPVYFERFLDKYASDDDLPLLRAGKVRFKLYDPVDVSSFDWTRGTSEYTWFLFMQEMRFVLPLIAAERRGDRALARSWLERWHAAHPGSSVRPQKWGEPRAFAYRAMVFVYYLKVERGRKNPDTDVVAMLSESIAAHQSFLEQEHNFDGENNLGLIEALGLLETTRVHPNPEARSLAFARIRLLMKTLVSPLGTQLENSPLYHFVFLNWLVEIREYVHDLPGAPADLADELDSVAGRMRAAGHFLQDHTGIMPQIGDTDSMSVATHSAQFISSASPNGTARFYDRAGGYAVFKGIGGDRRYVVLRIPLPGVRFPEHIHSDALALWVSDDGEVILGDAGRYTYTPGRLREYFVSASAHNTVLPRPTQLERRPAHFYRPVPWARDESSGDGARWWAVVRETKQRVARVVSVTGESTSIVVVDSIQALGKPSGDASATILWNLGGDIVRIEPAETGEAGAWSWTLTTRRGRRVQLGVTVHDYALAGPRVRIIRGEESPLVAWYSPRWGVRRPVWGIEVVLDTRPTAVLETRLTLPEP